MNEYARFQLAASCERPMMNRRRRICASFGSARLIPTGESHAESAMETLARGRRNFDAIPRY